MKRNLASINKGQFKIHKAYSPEEILAAGGATAFGRRMHKNNQKLITALNSAPAPEPFSSEEWDSLIEADSESSYSDELKEKLDKRYQDYIDGRVSAPSLH